jgi:hypothetical protein
VDADEATEEVGFDDGDTGTPTDAAAGADAAALAFVTARTLSVCRVDDAADESESEDESGIAPTA